MRRKVADVMTTDVATVRETASFKEVARLLGERRVSAVPVVDDDGKVVGVVSEADLLAKAQYPGGLDARPFEGRRRRALRAKAGGSTALELASRPAAVVTSEATVVEAVRLAARHQVKRLPVVGAGGELVGIVSRADLLKVFLRSDEEIQAEIATEIVGDHLWVEPDTLVIEVAGGVVTLEGELEQRTDVATLVRLAQAVDGVVQVDGRLTWRFDDTAKEGQGWRDSDRRRRGSA